MVKYLVLECGADVHARDYSGYDALQLARENGHLEVVEYLKSKGAVFVEEE
jgi:ankyrin repeat protein